MNTSRISLYIFVVFVTTIFLWEMAQPSPPKNPWHTIIKPQEYYVKVFLYCLAIVGAGYWLIRTWRTDLKWLIYPLLSLLTLQGKHTLFFLSGEAPPFVPFASMTQVWMLLSVILFFVGQAMFVRYWWLDSATEGSRGFSFKRRKPDF